MTNMTHGPKGFDHQFFLVSVKEHSPADYRRFINAPGAVLLHDDIINYMHDTLQWIPTLNAATGEDHYGLCYYGPTAIQAKGSHAAQQVFCAWSQLLSAGPPHIRLTGAWCEDDGSVPPKRFYETVEVNRDSTVASLKDLSEKASRVSQSHGDLFILHIGI